MKISKSNLIVILSLIGLLGIILAFQGAKDSPNLTLNIPDTSKSAKEDYPLTEADIKKYGGNRKSLTEEQRQRLIDFKELDAFTAAHEFVKTKLISPSTAEFFYSYEHAVTKIDDTTWFVDSFVDSQNIYGAMIKKRFVCKFTFDPIKNEEHCLDVEILPNL